MTLHDELEKWRPEIRTESMAMSVGEWMSLYKEGELDIHPEFQRLYRWEPGQKSSFIESILLGIPIPPIFVAQSQSGIWDVVDGVQRLSTLFQFAGIYVDEQGTTLDPLVLEQTEFLTSLQGKYWDHIDKNRCLTLEEQRYIKRAKLDVNIILRESDDFVKYELFKRLNTGGTALSDQEIRDCILVQLNSELFQWLQFLSEFEPFNECVVLTDNAISQQYNLELILRFIIFRTIDISELSSIGDLGNFITDKMMKLAKDPAFDKEEEKQAFKTTFEYLFQNTKENSFRKYDAVKEKFVGGFLASPFEVFGIGLGHNYRAINNVSDIREKVVSFWRDIPSELRVGSGVRASTRIPTTILFGRNLFR